MNGLPTRTWISRSVGDTEALGARIGGVASQGQVIGLGGDLGAGKTALIRGLARGLGFTGRIHSPTFSLINLYEGGRLPLFHLDLYRLDGPAAIHEAGLDDYLIHPEGISAVEWIGRWTPPHGTAPHWSIHLTAINETTREITHDVPGL